MEVLSPKTMGYNPVKMKAKVGFFNGNLSIPGMTTFDTFRNMTKLPEVAKPWEVPAPLVVFFPQHGRCGGTVDASEIPRPTLEYS